MITIVEPKEMIERSLGFTLRNPILTLLSILIFGPGLTSFGTLGMKALVPLTAFPYQIIWILFMIYLSAGMYATVLKKIINGVATLESFRVYAKNYFFALLTTCLLLLLFDLIFSLSFSWIYSILSERPFKEAALKSPLIMVEALLFQMATVYCIPSIFLKEVRNLGCLRFGLMFLLKNFKESIPLLILISVQVALTGVLKYLGSLNRDLSLLSSVALVVREAFGGYLHLIVFMTAAQMIHPEGIPSRAEDAK